MTLFPTQRLDERQRSSAICASSRPFTPRYTVSHILARHYPVGSLDHASYPGKAYMCSVLRTPYIRWSYTRLHLVRVHHVILGCLPWKSGVNISGVLLVVNVVATMFTALQLLESLIALEPPTLGAAHPRRHFQSTALYDTSCSASMYRRRHPMDRTAETFA